MPDPYIIFRAANSDKAKEWRMLYIRLSDSRKAEFLKLLGEIHLPGKVW